MTDAEALKLINDLTTVNYKTDKEGSQILQKLQDVYPEISDIIFWDFRDLTDEEILKEAKAKTHR